MTVVEQLTKVIDEIADKKLEAGLGYAAREFELAKTAAEEAQMRYTHGRAIQEGQFEPYDFDKVRVSS